MGCGSGIVLGVDFRVGNATTLKQSNSTNTPMDCGMRYTVTRGCNYQMLMTTDEQIINVDVTKYA